MIQLVNPLTQQPISNDELSQLTDLIQSQSDLENRIRNLEEELDAAKKQLFIMQTSTVPGAMDALGLRQLMLSNNAIVRVDPFYSCSISDRDPENKARGLAWLRLNNCGAIIRNEVSVPIPPGQDKAAEKLAKWLLKAGMQFHKSETVHNATLKSLMRERIEQGKAFPMDIFKGFAGKKATIELPK